MLAATSLRERVGQVIIRFRFVRTESGASLVEYAFLLGLIAVVCVGALTILGSHTSNKYSDVANSFPP